MRLQLERVMADLEWARPGRAEQVLRGEDYSWEKTRGEGWEGSSDGSLEEFTARSDGGFEATGPAEAEGNGDVWCAATATAAAPADMAGAANFPSVADNAGASEGVSRDSGAVVAPESEQTWTDAGGFDRDKMCIVGGDQEKAGREELAAWRRHEDDGGGGDQRRGAGLGGGATSRPWAAVCRLGWRGVAGARCWWGL